MIAKFFFVIAKKKTENYVSAFKIGQKKNLAITKKNLAITFFSPKIAQFWHKTWLSNKSVILHGWMGGVLKWKNFS